MLVRLLDGTDHDAARVIPWQRGYGPLPALPEAVSAAAADLADLATDEARPGADVLALVAGTWQPGRAHLTQPRPRHRPRQDPSAARVMYAVRVHPSTRAAILAEAERTGESQGQVVDRLVQSLLR